MDRAGLDPKAEQLLSRSVDGWSASTPVYVALDGRDAIVAKMEARYGKERVARTIGDGRKEIAPSERANYGRTNRSVHATRALRAGEIVGPSNILSGPRIMASEDYALFAQRVPSTYFFVGAGDEATGKTYDHHHPKFDLDEASMAIGIESMVNVALRYLEDAPHSQK